MILSPLILKTYFLTNVAVKAAVPAFPTQVEAIKAISGGAMNITSKVEVAKNHENPRDWRVALQLSCRPTEGKFGLYVIDLELLGFFEVHTDFDSSKVEELVLCNGPALLLGAARELLLLITSRCPIAPFTLPSASFIDLKPAKRQEECAEKTGAAV